MSSVRLMPALLLLSAMSVLLLAFSSRSHLVERGALALSACLGPLVYYRATRALQRAVRSRDKLARVAERTSNAVLLTDANGRIEWVNAAYAVQSGYAATDVLGVSELQSVDEAESDAAATAALRNAFHNGISCRATVALKNKAGATYWVDVTMEPIRVDGVLQGFLSVQTNVTDQVRLTRSLRSAREHADRASAAKSDFLASMSHEIRTPLSAILGYVDVLRDGASADLTSEQDHAIRTIGRAGEHLMQVLNNVLDLSKIEARQMTIAKAAVDLPAVLLEIESLMRARAHQKGLTLRFELATAIPSRVRTDPTRFRQILTNLIGNAIKYTDRGEVTVSASSAMAGGNAELCVRVRDTGIGIEPQAAAELFQPFRQLDTEVTPRGGTGLGLAISRQLAAYMHGEVRLLESTPGIGSCFELRLVVEVCGDASSCTMLSPIASVGLVGDSRMRTLSGHVLLAEDGEDNQRILAHLLRRAGAIVTVAENGREALRVLRELHANLPVDLVLSDMQMPEMDGYELVRELRRAGMAIPVVALTAHAMPEDRQRCLAAGCDDYVSKPVRHQALIALCARWLNNTDDTVRESPRVASDDAIPLRLTSTLQYDPELAAVAAGFALALPARVRAIQSAFVHRPAAEARRLTHQLKGAAGSYGYPHVTRVAQSLEVILRDGLSPCVPLLQELEQLANAAARAAKPSPVGSIAVGDGLITGGYE